MFMVALLLLIDVLLKVKGSLLKVLLEESL